MLEACYVQKKGSSLDSSTVVQKTDWEIYIIQLANEITKEQTPQRLLAARYVKKRKTFRVFFIFVVLQYVIVLSMCFCLLKSIMCFIRC